MKTLTKLLNNNMKSYEIRVRPTVLPIFFEKWASMLFLPLRVWLGWEWLTSGYHKLFNPAWMVSGEALKGFWAKAVVVDDGKGAITYDWYRSFIQYLFDIQAYTWFAKLVACGEIMVGIALIIGAFVGVAAFFGALMNWNFMMAGSASTNPMLFLVSIFLILGWRVAGYIGADYFLLAWLRQRLHPIYR